MCVCVCVCARALVHAYVGVCARENEGETDYRTDRHTDRTSQRRRAAASAVKCNIKTQHVTIVVLNELPAADKKGTEVAVMYINPQRNATEISNGLRANYIQLLCSGTVHGIRFIITTQEDVRLPEKLSFVFVFVVVVKAVNSSAFISFQFKGENS